MSQTPEQLDPQTRAGLQRYWRDTRRIIVAFLIVWFVVSCVLGIFFVEQLNQIKIGGFPLGFWIAQQGSIYVFIILIGAYCWLMEYGDRKFHLQEEKRKRQEYDA